MSEERHAGKGEELAKSMRDRIHGVSFGTATCPVRDLFKSIYLAVRS
jgi:hypothetical protein